MVRRSLPACDATADRHHRDICRAKSGGSTAYGCRQRSGEKIRRSAQELAGRDHQSPAKNQRSTADRLRQGPECRQGRRSRSERGAAGSCEGSRSKRAGGPRQRQMDRRCRKRHCTSRSGLEKGDHRCRTPSRQDGSRQVAAKQRRGAQGAQGATSRVGPGEDRRAKADQGK